MRKDVRQKGNTLEALDTESGMSPTDSPDSTQRFRVVAIVAAVMSVVFAAPQFAVLRLASTYQQLYADMGGKIPVVPGFVLRNATGIWFAVVLAIVDLAIFWFMYRLAKRYWIGLLFVPILVFIATAMLTGWLMYMPMYSVITLVQ